MEPETIFEFDSKCRDGRTYRIRILQHYQVIESDVASTVLPTRKEMRTAEGYRVNRIQDGKYFIIGPNVEVEKF